MRFSSIKGNSDSELGVLAAGVCSKLEIDVSIFESPAVVSGCGFVFGVIDTVNDKSVNQFDDSDIVLDGPE